MSELKISTGKFEASFFRLAPIDEHFEFETQSYYARFNTSYLRSMVSGKLDRYYIELLVFYPVEIPLKNLEAYFGPSENHTEKLTFEGSEEKSIIGIEFGEISECETDQNFGFILAEAISGSIAGK